MQLHPAMHPQPSPFFQHEDQENLHNMEEGRYQPRFDIEDYPVEEDKNENRFTREVIQKHVNAPTAEYYNDWIMENLG
jgi:hypothetical protein